ncbi:MAG: hypothetical protein ACR5K4_03085 [Sodalis sp. (in: enterobacteria)]
MLNASTIHPKSYPMVQRILQAKKITQQSNGRP